jgi:malate dehydrogenase (oxaloacetate-decarboxylating)
VVARQAQRDGVATFLDESGVDARIEEYMWTPHYRRYVKGGS